HQPLLPSDEMVRVGTGSHDRNSGPQSGSQGGSQPADGFPTPPRLQLATFSETPPSGDDWLHEIKFDGYRIAATVVAGHARLTTRNLLDWTHRFAAIASALALLPVTSAVLDGEIVALDKGNRTDFAGLQHWLSRQTLAATSGIGTDGEEDVRIAYQTFDLLSLDGRDLKALPLLERKQALEELLQRAQTATGNENYPLRFTEHGFAPGPQVLKEACQLGLEGAVSKRRDASSRPGRNEEWLKSACLSSDEFVIGGFTHPRGSRTGLGALLLGELEAGGSRRYVGKVGTGFDDDTLVALSERLQAHTRPDSPFATEVPRVATSAGVTWRSEERRVGKERGS